MATLSERLALAITADVDDAVRGLNKLEKTAARDIGRTEARVDQLGTKFTKIGAGMLSVGVLGAAGLVKAADKTRQLADESARAETIFGSAYGRLQEEAENAIDTLGLSERSFLEANSSVAVFGRGAGLAGDDLADFTGSIVDVTRDLASFKGANFEDAIGSIGAAFRGEFDSAEQFGIQLSAAKIQAEGAARGLGTLEQGSADYVAVVRDLILEQSEAIGALGDYDRTSDSATNQQQRLNEQMENFQAALGEGVLPVMTAVMDVGGDLLDWFNDLDPATQKVVSQTLTWGSVLLVAGGALSTVVGQVIKMRDNLRLLGTKLRGNMLAIGAVTAVAATAALVYKRWADQAERTRQRVSDMTLALQSHDTELQAVSTMVEVTADHVAELDTAMAAAGVSNDDMAAAVLAGGDALDELADRLRIAALESGESANAAEAASEVTRRLGDDYADATDELERMNKITNTGADDELPGLEDAADDTAAAIENLGTETKGTYQAAEDLSRAWGELVSQLLGGVSAQTNAMLLVEETNAALDDLDGKTTAEVRAEMERLAGKYADVAAAAAESGEDVDSELADVKTALFNLGVEAGLSADYIGEIAAALDTIDGKRVEVQIGVDAAAVGDAISGFVPGYVPPTPSYAEPPFQVDKTGGGKNGLSASVPVNVTVDGQVLAETVAQVNLRSGGGIG